MNVIFRNNIAYHYESFWRKSKNDDTYDSNGKKFPWPKEGDKYWTDKEQFKNKLLNTQRYLISKHKLNTSYYNNKNCLICGKKNITTGTFNLNNVIWEDGLIHYVDVHNIKPDNDFVALIYKIP
jgi:hypothetical protein